MTTSSSGDAIPIPEEIERRLELFEANRGKPDAPTIERLLAELPETDRPSLLRELLKIEFELIKRDLGKIPLEEYLPRFPEYDTVVREAAVIVEQYGAFQRPSIDDFSHFEKIGQGGMGVVYKARNIISKNDVAIKMVRRQMSGNGQALERFIQEIAMIEKLDHPNIVKAKHAGKTVDGSLYLVMEFLEGITLLEWSRKNPPAEIGKSQRIATACAIIRDTAKGLQAIHEAGLVHRDIKPGNVMLLPGNRVKILDLGLAKLREHLAEDAEYAPRTREGQILGTPGYTAPEQADSPANVDIRADIYSLGCTLFFLLYGRSPTEKSSKELSVPLPAKLQTILDRMLAADRESRFQQPREVVEALEAFLAPSWKFRLDTISLAVLAVACLGIALVLPFSEKGDAAKLSKAESTEAESTKIVSPETELTKAVSMEDESTEAKPMKAVPPDDPPPEPPPGEYDATLTAIQNAVDLRYQGKVEKASEALEDLEKTLRAEPFAGSGELLAEVLAAQGDHLFFSGLASGAIREKMLRRMTAWYEEAVELAGKSAESTAVFRAKQLCKLAVTKKSDAAELAAVREILRDAKNAGDKNLSLFLQFAEAVSAPDDDDEPLRKFAEEFEANTDPELTEGEPLDLRLFALERLIAHDAKAHPEKLSKDLRALDGIPLMIRPTAESSVFLNRFFDQAICATDPADHGQIVTYLRRWRCPNTAARSSHPTKSTFFLIYLSPRAGTNGFAIYYPANRQEARRFELSFSRREVMDVVDGKSLKPEDEPVSLKLDDELVSLIRRDLGLGIPVILSWEDIACWEQRRDALSYKDWPFDESITVAEIMGRMK